MTVKSSVLKQMEDLKEETGLTCCICREGYRYQPAKVRPTADPPFRNRTRAIGKVETGAIQESYPYRSGSRTCLPGCHVERA